MEAVDLIVEPGVDPLRSAATDRYLMRAVGRRKRKAVLRIYSFPGEWVSLGRYHALPAQGAGHVFRRRSGGRALPFGEGFVGVSLVLPHRAALFGDDPLLLNPAQVLNRYVRGVLEGFRIVGVSAQYPGRDLVTANRRAVAAISFETDEVGVALFEGVIALERDFTPLPQLLERIDPEGVVKLEMMAPDRVSTLSMELGRPIPFEELVEALRFGFGRQFSLRLRQKALSLLEQQAIDATLERDFAARWLAERRVEPTHDRHSIVWAQLGAFEVSFSLHQERFLKEVQVRGDFIANSPSIGQLERKLRLCPLEWQTIDAVVNDVFREPGNYVLGIGKLRTIADTLMRGATTC